MISASIESCAENEGGRYWQDCTVSIHGDVLSGNVLKRSLHSL